MANRRVIGTQPEPLRWQGKLDGMHGTLLFGWALDVTDPDARVMVQICFNGEILDTVFADIARPDLVLPQSFDICHGFVFDTALIQATGNITVKVANSNFQLPGQLEFDAPSGATKQLLSLVYGNGDLRLCGYALNPLDAASCGTVRAYVADRQVAEAVADQDLPQLRSNRIGRHGFSLDLPLDLADGERHSVTVVDESGVPLNGSPVSVCCYAAGVASLLSAGTSPLLHQVIHAYEALLPRSVGWSAYTHWAKQFAPPASANGALPRSPSDSSAVSVALLIHGAALLPVTKQVGIPCKQFFAGPDASAFESALKKALASPAQWLTCIRAGDHLPANALKVALSGSSIAAAEIIYTDSEAKSGKALLPWLKPAWNLEYALATDYPLELMLLNTATIRRYLASHPVPGNAAELAWGMLGFVHERASSVIVHVPHVLYRFESPLGAAERLQRQQAAQTMLRQLEPTASLQSMLMEQGADFSLRRLQRSMPASETSGLRVSLIIPTRDQAALLEACITSLLQWTDWPNLEIIIVDNDSVEKTTHALFRKLKKQGIRILPVSGPFNFARVNNVAVAQASGDVIGMINNDIEALHAGWLQEMLSHLQLEHVGAVGAKLLWPNRMVQHGGILLGMNLVAGHFGNLWHEADCGDHGRNQVTLQVSGVTAACLLMRKSDYLAMGGMDEVAFPVAFNDVDLCLRLRSAGKSIIWTPFATLLHAESASRGREDSPQKQARARREIDQLQRRWRSVLLHDPAYHPSLNLDSHSQAFSGLALPPRRRTPRLAGLIIETEETNDHD